MGVLPFIWQLQPLSPTSPLALVLRPRPHRRAGGGGGLLAIPVRAARDGLAPLPAGSLSTASSLQSEHPFHQLDENLAGFEHTGRGAGVGWGASVVPVGRGAPSSRRDSSLLQSLLSGTWHQPLHFDSFYFKLSSISPLGKGRREAGEVAVVCGEQGTQEQLANPKPVGRVVLNL